MQRHQIALVICNLAATLVIGGALYDLLVPVPPPNHARYIGEISAQSKQRVAELDLAMLRSLGGALLAIGVASLILINGPLRRGDRSARMVILILIAVAEANNAYRMYPFGSPWYAPLSFVVLMVVGVFLAGARDKP